MFNDELRDNFDVVNAAWIKNTSNMQFASERLRKNFTSKLNNTQSLNRIVEFQTKSGSKFKVEPNGTTRKTNKMDSFWDISLPVLYVDENSVKEIKEHFENIETTGLKLTLTVFNRLKKVYTLNSRFDSLWRPIESEERAYVMYIKTADGATWKITDQWDAISIPRLGWYPIIVGKSSQTESKKYIGSKIVSITKEDGTVEKDSISSNATSLAGLFKDVTNGRKTF
jgi:hypothetical protein